MKELKNRAAKISANGILLTKSGSQNNGSTGFFFNDFYTSSSTESITAQDKAIFVINE
jgi:hypothetical protein